VRPSEVQNLDALMHAFADRLDVHPPGEWSMELVAGFIALMDVHFAAGGTNEAPVLKLVRS
jgi:hypothetical protein